MKIGILTLPLRNYNYGGILQAYALSEFLKQKGHSVIVLDRVFPEPSAFRKFLGFAKRSLLRYLLLQKVFITKRPFRKTVRNYESFLSRYIQMSKPLQSNQELQDYVSSENLEALIVGSDQVWRKYYTPDLYNYFLDFTKGMKIRRILFAASFGVDLWELSSHQTEMCSRLIRNFDFISVREDSAVELCKIYFDTEAVLLPDPTILFNKDLYLQIIESDNTSKIPGELFYYILDETPGKLSFVDEIASARAWNSFSSKPGKRYSDRGLKQKDIDDCIEPSISQWLRNFRDTQFVLTDSLHGCIFSIIFNRPFVVIGNENRGIARVSSLLRMFSLEDRLIKNSEDLKIVLDKPIDWEKVNKIKSDKCQESVSFLDSALIRKPVSEDAASYL